MKKNLFIAFMCALMVFIAVSCEEPHTHSYEVVKDGGKLVKKCTACGNVSSEAVTGTLVSNADGLKNALNGDATTIYLGTDITLTEAITSSKDLVIDLNGKIITFNEVVTAINNSDNVKLTLKNGTINCSFSASSTSSAITNSGNLKTKDLVIEVTATVTSEISSTGAIIAVNNTGAFVADSTKISLKLKRETGNTTTAKGMVIYSNCTKTESTIKNSTLSIESETGESTYGYYILVSETPKGDCKATFENTTIKATCSAQSSITPVFVESYVVKDGTEEIAAVVELKKCNIYATSTYKAANEKTTYGVRTKGPVKIILDTYTVNHITIDKGQGKEAKLAAEVQNNAGSGKDKRGIIWNSTTKAQLAPTATT